MHADHAEKPADHAEKENRRVHELRELHEFYEGKRGKGGNCVFHIEGGLLHIPQTRFAPLRGYVSLRTRRYDLSPLRGLVLPIHNQPLVGAYPLCLKVATKGWRRATDISTDDDPIYHSSAGMTQCGLRCGNKKLLDPMWIKRATRTGLERKEYYFNSTSFLEVTTLGVLS